MNSIQSQSSTESTNTEPPESGFSQLGNSQLETPQPNSQRPQSGATRKRVMIVAAVLLCLTGVAAVIGSMQHGQKPAEKAAVRTPVLTVTVAEVKTESIPKNLAVHGTISAWDPVSVGASAGGLEVKNILVDDGSMVKQGQTLATLDSATLRAQLDSEKARLASSLANVNKSVQPNRREDINGLAAAVAQSQANVLDAQANLVQAQANLENAEVNAPRYLALKETGAVSVQEYEQHELNLKVGRATQRSASEKVRAAEFLLTQAKERLSMARVGGRKEDIDIANASVAEIRGNVRRLQTQIDQTIIKAPVDGMIVRRDTHLGDISTVGKTMFYVARDNRLELRAQIPQEDLKNVTPGQTVNLDASSGTSTKLIGKVREISPMVDADSRLATVRIDIPANSGLKAGIYAEGTIAVGQANALAVPPQAVMTRDEKTIVYVLHNDLVEARTVTTGARTNTAQEIVSGVSAGEKVVVNGAGFLKDGDCVAVSQK